MTNICILENVILFGHYHNFVYHRYQFDYHQDEYDSSDTHAIGR